VKWISIILMVLFFTDVSSAQEKKVFKEFPYTFKKDQNGKLKIKKRKYTNFRPSWGKRITLLSAIHSPEELIDADTLGELTAQENRLPFQVDLSIVKNFSLFSVGLEGGVMNLSWSDANEQNIKIINYYGGLVFMLDGILNWPYVVPVVSAGALFMDAESAGAKIEIAEDYLIYYRAGLLISLNWLDRITSHIAYDDFGLINTNLYVGIRKWQETLTTPELSIKPSIEFGLQLEF